jgi:hypothetical protein
MRQLLPTQISEHTLMLHCQHKTQARNRLAFDSICATALMPDDLMPGDFDARQPESDLCCMLQRQTFVTYCIVLLAASLMGAWPTTTPLGWA